ncbi:MAG: hypothetical protein Q8P55_00375 [bacterium]|nr:hypothetical protein [bacterium]
MAKDIEHLLNEQTKTILNAVDEKLSITEVRILSDVDKKILASEERINRKIEKLTTTLDQFLKRMTDMEDEFTMMKNDLNRVKQVIKDKLGIELT